MTTYTFILYQIVFGTKRRIPALVKENRGELFAFIIGILKNKNCHVYQVNGVEDHIHILTHVHPSIAVSDLVKDIKISCSLYIKEKNLFPRFSGWQEGFGAFTYSKESKENLIRYVINQEEHHKSVNFKAEYTKLLEDFDIDFIEKYML